MIVIIAAKDTKIAQLKKSLRFLLNLSTKDTKIFKLRIKKKFFCCHPGLDPGSRSPISLNTSFETFHLESGSMLPFDLNDKLEALKALILYIKNGIPCT